VREGETADEGKLDESLGEKSVPCKKIGVGKELRSLKNFTEKEGEGGPSPKACGDRQLREKKQGA